MSTRVTCSWCHESPPLAAEGPTWCPRCSHRADLSRSGCTCPRCLEAWRQAGRTVLGQIADAVAAHDVRATRPPAREEEAGGPELRGVAEAVLAWLQKEKHEHGPEGERLRRLLADALGRAEGG